MPSGIVEQRSLRPWRCKRQLSRNWLGIDRTYGAARLSRAEISSGIAMAGKGRCNLRPWASGKSREVIYGGRVRAANPSKLGKSPSCYDKRRVPQPGFAAASACSSLCFSPAVSAFPERVVGSACALSFSRIAQRSLALRPTDALIEGFSHFVASMTAPIASGWSGCRVGFAPTGKRRLVTAHTRFRH